MKYSGAEIIVHLLEKKGIDTIAGIPGSANLPLYRALHDSKIKHVLARHEQGAGFIAQGMARSTGKAAVCFATSGPGATNLLTAIADAKLDSVPVVAFTGQVATSLIGTDAFQEIDTYGLTIPITKHNFLVRSAAELLDVIPEAFRIAETGRPGPVVIDVPKDVQQQVCEFGQWPGFHEPTKPQVIEKQLIDKIAQAIHYAVKPVIMFGAGIIESGSCQLLRLLAEKNNIPLTSTMRGLGAISPEHPLYVGMIGMHGTKYANRITEEADLILALGLRFDDRATGKVSEFCRNAQIIHVDIDKAEINKIKPAFMSVNADLHDFLSLLIPSVDKKERREWLDECYETKDALPYVVAPLNGDVFHPLRIIDEVAASIPADSIITTDVGQHQMWVAMKYPITSPRTFLTSGGLGTMGFGVPTAIGAALANPGKKVVAFSGDGSFMMNMQELATIADEKPNMAILLFNNGTLGLVRQQQELFFDKKYIGSKFKSTPDFAGIAKCFGLKSIDLEKVSDPLGALHEALQLNEPVFINVPVNADENVFPMVPPGAANKVMID
ncbi:MAG: biosynthetic-type acetolactate synthase large subunit [Prolixibacteraceae bacterium]|nr:biosynthetic-type acetolactate synthase large subunit [Prolixibacteraceae bacterium]MBN2650226.1 biosynthetic-type acetolactate synthase large subunit [Prolixibacteraceae bacterium]